MHIPKTGGTALTQALALALNARRHLAGWDRSMLGDYSEFETWPRERLTHVYMTPAATPAGADLVTGHFAFSTLAARYPHARKMTVLREPRSRLLSHWLFWRAKTGDLFAEVGSYAPRVWLARRPLAEFLQAPDIAAQTDNVATRLLLWPHPLIPERGFIAPGDDALLARAARERLATFDFADVSENASLGRNLADWLARAVDLGRLNVTPRVPAERRGNLDRDLADGGEEALAQRTRLDDALWSWLAERVLGPRAVDGLRAATRASDDQRFRELLAG